MKKILFLLLLTVTTYAQTIISDSKLKINHGDITLYLTKDTCSYISVHKLTYQNYLNLDNKRDNKWFKDKFKKKYSKEPYKHTGYDLGHLTPSHITSYDDKLNHDSFSLFNQAPQLSEFNRGKWSKLERYIELMVSKYKKDAVIVSGVIYEPKRWYLYHSRIPIPMAFYKIIYIDNNVYCWIGSNDNGLIMKLTLEELNDVFKENKMNLIISF